MNAREKSMVDNRETFAKNVIREQNERGRKKATLVSLA